MGIHDDHNLAGEGNIDWEHIMPLLHSAPRLKVIQSEFCPVTKKVSFTQMVSRLDGLLKIK
jgi:hypothetical protein